MEVIVVSAFFSVLVAFQCAFKSCVARDTITHTTQLLDNGETLLSAGKIFELGFFNPQNDTHGGRYIGIWYYNLSPRTVVWVANRYASLNSPGSFLMISDDGNVQLLDNNGIVYFHTNLTSSTAANRTLRLLDSGNLALIDWQSGDEHLWESFSDPTDTFLPGMKMDKNLKLVSWLDPGNPTYGTYTFQQDQRSNRLQVIKKGNILYWESDGSGSTELPTFLTIFLSKNFTNATESGMVQNFTNASRSITYRNKRSQPSYDYFNNSRLLMNSSGEIQFYTLEEHKWSLKWSQPSDACSAFRPCGNFGMCKLINGASICNCLPGFDPVVPDNWKSGDFRNGCVQTPPICNENKQDKFLKLKFATVQEPGLPVPDIGSEDSCKKDCLNSCKCQACHWKNGSNYARPNCLQWTSTFNNLRHNVDDGQDIFIRVPASAIARTSRDCDPCGEYIIPYPLSLSTERACGDPSYKSFNCDSSTDQLFFLNNEVIDMKIKERKFVIQLNITAADNCDVRTSVLQLDQSMPFHVTNWCYSDLPQGPSTQGSQFVEIGWIPPPEPECDTSSDCEDWPGSDCYEKFGTKRCFCNSNYRWDGIALKCKQAANPKLSETVIIVVTVIAVVLLAGGFICFFYWRRILKYRGSKETIPGNPLNCNEGEAEDLVDEGDNVVDLPYFSLESILAATDNFADVNKLGQGGFGPVYKGTFPGGKEMAIKRLLSYSGQGMEEFRNEVVLIAKLQHRNLVRLLGYCIKGSEKLLLYEYMPNRSLDYFIFDQGRCILLDWNTRFNIIMGIARGLLYLHQDSRLRIIHRDLKTSNILLDEDMNPKISDFGLARIFAGKEMEANTLRVVGTYGYMSPEYAQAGLYSVKSDVFSFGVILLEIVSGKRNTRFYHSGEALSLPGYAWSLWEARNEINLFDNRILQSCNGVEVLKCINIGLLCVQEDAGDRPTMANVLIMLTSEVTTLPSPKKPGFISGKHAFSVSTSSSSHKVDANSENKMSITFPEGR